MSDNDETPPSGEFNLKIKTTNDAFSDKSYEVARILRDVAKRVDSGHESGAIMDSYGNRCGSWEMTT